MTTLLHESNIDNKLDKENKEPINFILQYFIPKDKIRLKEVQKCLFYNVCNSNINTIYLLNEKVYTNEELGIEKCKKEDISKIKQVNIKKRLTFKKVFDYAKENNIKGYIIFANSDIFFDITIRNILKSSLHKEKGIYALTRFEALNKDLRKCKLFGHGRADSQDTWIIHSNFIPKNTKIFNFKFGYPGCDQKLIYLFLIIGYKMYNAPYFIKTYHNHKAKERDYNDKPHLLVNKPWGMLIPNLPSKGQKFRALANTFLIQKYATLEHIYQRYGCDDFQMIHNMSYDSNELLILYLKKKIDNKENFVIPRIAGIENKVVYLTHKLNGKLNNMLYGTVDGTYNNLTDEQRKEIEYELHFSGIKNFLYTMKNNAGIQIRGTYSLGKYSKDYLKAFENCEIYCCWDNFGNVYPGIHESHDFVTKKFKKKTFVNALILDIFHYIHNPWTHALKGKRILIVSPFIDSIKKK